MSQLLNSYPVFEGNQVLTSSQLNQLVTYLDEQNRLTRSKLIGQGIFCGLEIQLDTEASPIELKISKGTGVTSQGYVASVGDCVIDRYLEYSLPADVNYPPFQDDTQTQDVALYELIAKGTNVAPGSTPLNLDDPSGFLNDKVVILFVECRDIDLKSCLGNSCDERGLDRVINVRKLLISKTDMNKVLDRTCTQASVFSEKYDLPEVIVHRTLFQPDEPESESYFDYATNYIDELRKNRFVSNTTTGSLFDNLFDALRQTYTDFAAILSPVYGGVNPFTGLPLGEWNDFMNGISPGPKYLGVQYFYDFVKDLILAYDEFRNVAFELMSECCPSMECFPKHLMLGEAVPNDSCQPSTYRHALAISPAFDGQKEKLKEAIMLHKRMVLMTRTFNLDLINNPNTTPVPPSTLGEPLFITPSNEKRDPLSDRAIPYYYRIDEPQDNLGTLEESWDYDFIKKCLFSKGLEPLSYQNQDTVQSNDQGPVSTPLYYDIDPYNFLRIEGAIGQNYLDVEDRLETLRQDFDLPFNYLTVRLQGEPLDDITERCNFEDLQTEYGTISTEIKKMASSLFDRFATLNSAGNVEVKDLPSFLSALFRDTDQGIGQRTFLGSYRQPVLGENPDGTLNEASRIFTSQAEQELRSNLLAMGQNLDLLLNDFLPFDISDLDFGYTGTSPNATRGFIQVYLDSVRNAIDVKVSLNQLLDLVTHSTFVKNSPDLYTPLYQYLTEVLSQLNDFIDNPAPESMTLLYYTYQYRFQYIQDNDLQLFSNFIEQNPGTTHQAGVPKGGTFVLLVNGNQVAVTQPEQSTGVQLVEQEQELRVQKALLEGKEKKSPKDDQRISIITTQLDQLALIEESLSDGAPIAEPVVDPFSVIGDFTLPYLTNCDCECLDIPAPQSIDQLNIPAIAKPFVVEYSMGDYAFGKEVTRSVNSSGQTEIEVRTGLRFDFPDGGRRVSVAMFLVNGDGERILFGLPPGATFPHIDANRMSTFNHPNDPDNTTQLGSVGFKIYETGQISFLYEPVSGFTGIDSFYYQFEIWEGSLTQISGIHSISNIESVTIEVN